jgi:peptide deformylase
MKTVATYQIRLFGDPVLTQRASDVTDIDGKLAHLVDDMIETMYEANGLGLAAPQVGVQKRLFVYQMEDRDPVAIINPTITESRGEWEHQEGCLSIPGLYFPIVRPKEIHLTGWDIHGHEVSIEADELEARCFQHELDHLEGRLLLEILDKDQRKEAMRELRLRAEADPRAATAGR